MELKAESDLLRKKHDQARSELQEATTKLSVLTQYFKDKELELQRSVYKSPVSQQLFCFYTFFSV